MKVSVFTTVTVRVTATNLKLSGLPDRFIGCFTGPPSRERLREAVQIKAEMQRVPQRMLKNILKVIGELPGSELDATTTTESGMVTVFTQEPLFKP